MTGRWKPSQALCKGDVLNLELPYDSLQWGQCMSIQSPEFVINNSVLFQSKIMRIAPRFDKHMYFVKFTSMMNNDLLYGVRYEHQCHHELAGFVENYTVDKTSWRLIVELDSQYTVYNFKISVMISITTLITPLLNRMHCDNELTDFELRGEDGSVHLHKAIAAAASPVMKARLSKLWGKDGKCVSDAPPNTTQATLQHLKDYIYLGRMPNFGIEELLLLAAYYIMPSLEERCAHNLLTEATGEKAHKLMEFAMRHNNANLLYEIMQRVEYGSVKVKEIRQFAEIAQHDRKVVKVQPPIKKTKKRKA